MYQVLHIFLRPDLVDDLLSFVEEQGSLGATILRGRGTSHHQEQRFLNVCIEHQIAMVVLVVEQVKVKALIQALEDHFQFTEQGVGLLCTLPATGVRGLSSRRN
ncbi:MAG: hypothetical protein Q4D97_01970 [Eubacteriales bacterium]|nr:hypothetical protein [Eubacteriales bacterium]